MKVRVGADGQRWNFNLFMSHVEKTADGCWLWTAGLRSDGYGQGGRTSAHRASYLMHVGQIPDGLELDHLCCVPRCVNPEHLEPVTRAENARRRAERQTHCKHGHAFTDENTYHWRGTRKCLTCHYTRVRAYREAVAS